MTPIIRKITLVCLLASAVAGRVMNQETINKLLQEADPYENDVFYEPIPSFPKTAHASPIPSLFPSHSRRTEDEEGPGSVSPTAHILSAFSRPRYVDASEFRLPPTLDINRQLTLMSASKIFRPPVARKDIDVEANHGADVYGEVYFPVDAEPLFRGDFPSKDVEYSSNAPSEAEDRIDTVFVPADEIEGAKNVTPKYSVSVSTSVSYSTGEKSNGTDSQDSKIQSTTLIPSTSSTTTSPEAEIESKVSENIEQIHSDNGPKTAKLFQAEPPRRGFSDYKALSPLAHILGGFAGELGPFGGDQKRDSFVQSFRPFGF